MVNLNNPEDAALLGRAANRERLAKALAAGVADHFKPSASTRSGTR
jgi:N-acetylmuramoyl-L-alanine amidase